MMISVIIPVYNSEKYLKKCANSVLTQTYTDLECILVNDGSQDNSLQMCQSIAKNDSRVIIVDKKNEGVDKARFDGLAKAKGEFVTFVDSDDWLEDNALEDLMRPMSEYEADVVVGMRRNVYNVGCLYIRDWRKIIAPRYSKKLIRHDEMMEDYYLSFFGINILPVSVWATLYRRSIIEEAQLCPCGIGFGEDLVFNMKLMPYMRRYYMIDKIVYNYRRASWGTSSKYLDNWLQNARLLFDLKMSQIKKMNYTKAIKWQLIEYVNYLKTYIRNSLLYDSQHLNVRKSALQDEFVSYGYAHKVRPLSTMEYKDIEFFEAIQKEDVEGLFEITHLRLMQTSSLYKLKVMMGIN